MRTCAGRAEGASLQKTWCPHRYNYLADHTVCWAGHWATAARQPMPGSFIVTLWAVCLQEKRAITSHNGSDLASADYWPGGSTYFLVVVFQWCCCFTQCSGA